MGVEPVIRRFRGELVTTLHSPRSLLAISTTLNPWAATSTSHISRVRLGLAVPGGPGELRPDVLVIDAQETPGGRVAASRKGHEADEVVVAAELPLLLRRGLGLGVEGGPVGEDGVAPAHEHAVGVARRQDELVLRGPRHRDERERRLGFRAARREAPRRERGEPGGAAGEEPPAREPRRQDRLEGRVRARVDRRVVITRDVVVGPFHREPPWFEGRSAELGAILGRSVPRSSRKSPGGPSDQGLRCRASARNDSRLWAGRKASISGSAACIPWVSGW